MKKIYIFSIAIFSLFSACVSGEAINQNSNTTEANTNETGKKDQEIDLLNPIIQNGIIIGQFDPILLEATPYSNWYNTNYKRVKLNQDKLNTLKTALKNVQITGFIGTWCGDTKRDLPEFMRIMDEVKFDRKQISLFGVDRTYRTSELARKWGITNVPTFIFYRNGEEIGRYIEYPEISVLDDILEIVISK